MTVCWPAKGTTFSGLAPAGSRQQRTALDAAKDSGAQHDGGKAEQQGKGLADSHALGPTQGIVLIGLTVRVLSRTARSKGFSHKADAGLQTCCLLLRADQRAHKDSQ